jgi:GT2 family glycosyltransferase
VVPSVSERRNILIALMVYNGRDFVPKCMESLSGLSSTRHNISVAVLDDHSTDDGWSEELASLAAVHRFGYYCPPRNLGIPRNMSFALLLREVGGFDDVVLLNSDVVVPTNLGDVLGDVAASDPAIASVTAWSNNVSSFSIESTLTATQLTDAKIVREISAGFEAVNGATSLDLPVGVGYCMLITPAGAEKVGLLDPIFGRGYCEEVDWCQRARLAGLRNVLAPGCFVYHEGGATNRVSGLLAPGQTTVWANEKLIDRRYPDYRNVVDDFFRSRTLADLERSTLLGIVRQAAATDGATVQVARWRSATEWNRLTCIVDPQTLTWRCLLHGFSLDLTLDADDPLATVERTLGTSQIAVEHIDVGPVGRRFVELAARRGLPVTRPMRYPSGI